MIYKKKKRKRKKLKENAPTEKIMYQTITIKKTYPRSREIE